MLNQATMDMLTAMKMTATGFVPVYFWTRIKRGCKLVAARVLICWRRLTRRTPQSQSTLYGGTLYE